MADICHDCENPAWTGQTIEAPPMPGGGGEGGTMDFNMLDNRPKYDGKKMTGNTNIPDVTNDLARIEGEIADIEGIIPDAASEENQLADKNFVNSSVATNTANFVGTYDSLEELEAVENPSNNDYGFVVGTDEQGNTVYNRYKYVASFEEWQFEYALNNSSFTAAQWAAINSAITSSKVEKLDSLAEIKSIGDNLTLNPETGALSGAEPGIPKRATFWGQSYDDVNERVKGNIYLDSGEKIKQTGSATSLYELYFDNSGGLFYRGVQGKACGFYSGNFGFLSPSTGGKIVNILDPTDNYDAANKRYTDNLVISYSAIEGSSAPTTSTEGKYVGQLYFDTTNDKKYYLKAIDTTTDPDTYTWEEVQAGPTVVQSTGTSTTDVMSQKATTDMIYAAGYDPATSVNDIRIDINGRSSSPGQRSILIGMAARGAGANCVSVGASSSAGYGGNDNVAVGYNAIASNSNQGSGNVAIGGNAKSATDGYGSIAIGAYSQGTYTGEMNIGSTNSSYGYNNSNYRLLTGVHDPVNAQDASTKNYTDNLVISYSAIEGSSAPTTATEGKYVGQLYFDTANDKKYYLKAIDTTTDPDTYTWEEFGGGGIPTNATFWGQSYDTTNNKVDGNIIFQPYSSSTNPYIARNGTNTNDPRIAFFTNRIQLGSSNTNQGVGVNINTWQIKGLGDPTDPQDAATKNYVDTHGAVAFPTSTFNSILEEA